MDEDVYIEVVVPGFAGFVGVPGVDVIILLSPCDRRASARSDAVGLDGLRSGKKGGWVVNRKWWQGVLPLPCH